MVKLFRFFRIAKRNGGGLHVLFLPFVLPIIVLITHNRCTHKCSDHPQTDSQNITITPPSIPFGHHPNPKTTNIHVPHTKTLTPRNFRPNGTPYPQEQDITKTNLYVIHTKNINTTQLPAKRNLVPARAGYNENKPLRNPHTKTLTLRNFRPNGTSYPQEQDKTINNLSHNKLQTNYTNPHIPPKNNEQLLKKKKKFVFPLFEYFFFFFIF